MSTKKILVFLLFLSACTQDLVYSEIAPSWVNSLRSGDSRLRLVNGNKILFRTNYSDATIKNKNNLCSEAIKQNTDFIKKSYPYISQIPMNIELVFYDPKVKDCSTTISISKELIDSAGILKAQKSDYDKQIKKIATEKKKVDQQLASANQENTLLQQKILKLNNLLEQNQGYAKQIRNLEDYVDSLRNERKQIDKKVNEFIYTGMTKREIRRIMYGHEENQYTQFRGLCGVASVGIMQYGNWIFCGISSSDNYLTSFCDIRNKQCYKKDLN
ncbi:MAG: hypothetical protein MJ250_07685 [Alphaproteobacteria bacterium]|nr:hypothetical protein [Alphaproteobacteria bacterium]